MALTVGQLNVELEATTKEFNERLDEAEKKIEELGKTTEEVAQQTSKSFVEFAKAIGTLNITIGATAAKAVGFVTIIRALGLVIPQVRIAAIALGAALAAIGISRVGREGIQLAAAFEQTEVALETLTGSAAQAKIVLDDVRKITLETPFALTELANVARTMAVVFGDSGETIAEFTRITADIAAISGKNVEQIGQQIQRAVVSGLASAEVLKEAGITQLLLEQANVTDVAALRGEKLLQAFRDLTAEGGRAFRAAIRQAQTLAGALSNAEIAAAGFSRQFGKALSPATIIRANATEDAFVNLTAALESATPAIVALSTVFNQVLAASFRSISFGIRAAAILFDAFGAGLVTIQLIIIALAAVIDGVVRAQFSALQGIFRLLTGDIDGAVQSFKDFIDVTDSPVIELLGNSLQIVAVAGEDVINAFKGLVGATDITQKLADAVGFSTETTRVFGNTAGNTAQKIEELTERTEEQVAALDQLTKLGAALGTTTIEARIAALGEEIGLLSTLQVNVKDRELLDRRLLDLAKERARLQSEIAQEASAGEALPATLREVNEQIRLLGEVDPRAATEFAIALSEALTQAGDTATEQILAAAQIRQDIRDQEVADRIANELEIENERIQIEQRVIQAREAAEAGLRGDIRAQQLANITDERIRALAVLQDEIAATERLAETGADQELIAARLLQLTEERLRIEKELATAQMEQREAIQVLPDVLGRVNEAIGQVAELDPARATQLAMQLQDALEAAGDDPEALVQAAANFGVKVQEILNNLQVPTFGETVGDTVLVGIQRALTGGDIGIGQTFADSLIAFGQPALNELFEDAVENFGKLLDNVLESAAGFLEGIDFGGLGETFGGLGNFLKGPAGKATIGLIGQGISAALGGDEVTSAAARTVSSAVESTARVRGIVAGPTSIAVAQVDRAISDAFIETNFILRRIEENTRATATQTSDTGTGSVPTGGTSEATQALANEGPSFL